MTPWLIILLLIFIPPWENEREDIAILQVAAVAVEAGNEAIITVLVEVRQGYHIQAHEVQDEFIIPTTLEIDGGKEFKMHKQDFPPPRKFKLESADDYLEVYDGKFEIHTYFSTGQETPRKLHQLNGRLNYQACDSVRCLFPRTIEFLAEVRVY